jgi:tetratricopeptide (TPR) repeat protein
VGGRAEAGRSTGERTSFASVVLICLGLLAAVLVVYAPVRQFGFVTWDDPQYVSQNPQVLAGLGWQSIRWAFTTTHAGLWVPLTWLSLMLDVEVWGSGAAGHHVTNLLLHAANTLLLFGLLHRSTGALGRSAFVAALFALHPLHVESVAWITERKDVLSTFFGLWALWAWVAYARRPGGARYFAVAAAFGASLMAKPMLVTLPFLLLLLDVWPLGRLRLSSSAPDGRERHRAVLLALVREKVPLFSISLVAGVVTYLAQERAGAVSALEAVPLGARIQNALVSYVAYIVKMLWPSGLAGLYPQRALPPTWVLGSAALIGILTAGAILAARRHPYVPVGWLWYLGTLVPAIGIVQVGIQARADRFTYVPVIGLFIVIAWGAWDLALRWPQRRAALAAAAVAVCVALAAAARAQVEVWRNSFTFWQHAVDVTGENGRARGNLGLALAELGRTGEAIVQYTEAIRITPELVDVHTHLANALARQGNTAGAVAHYQDALRFDPSYLEAHNGLGSALDDQQRYAEAITHYREALRIDPGSAMVHNNLGAALLNLGNVAEAMPQFTEAVRLAPDDVGFRFNAAVVLARAGRGEEAARQAAEVLRRRPDHADARRLLESLQTSGAPGP